LRSPKLGKVRCAGVEHDDKALGAASGVFEDGRRVRRASKKNPCWRQTTENVEQRGAEEEKERPPKKY